MIEPIRDTVVSRMPKAQGAVLSCRVRTSKGERVEGNLQLELLHLASGLRWRHFRYFFSAGEHVFHGLPAGEFTLKAEAAGFDPFAVAVLIEGHRAQIDVFLQAATVEPLILNVAADSLLQHERLASALAANEQTADFLKDCAFSLRTRLAAALLSDVRVRNALESRPWTPGNGRLAEWFEHQIRRSWDFKVETALADRIIAGLVKARLRFVELISAISRCVRVQQLVPELGRAAPHLARFMATLDAPELDGVHPLLVQLFEPGRVVIEKFLRSIQNDFELRPPRGVAITAERGGGNECEMWPALDDCGDTQRPLFGRDIPSMRVLQLADAMANAVEGGGGGDARPVS